MQASDSASANENSMGLIRAWSPYLFVAGSLVLTRLRALNMEAFLKAITLKCLVMDRNFWKRYCASFQPLWSPGTIL